MIVNFLVLIKGRCRLSSLNNFSEASANGSLKADVIDLIRDFGLYVRF